MPSETPLEAKKRTLSNMRMSGDLESARVVTSMTRPPRPPTALAPNPSAVGNALLASLVNSCFAVAKSGEKCRLAQRQRNHFEFDPDSVRGSSGMANRKSKGSYRMKSRTSTSLTVTVRAGVTAKRT